MEKKQNPGITSSPEMPDMDLLRLNRAGRQVAKGYTIQPAVRTAATSVRRHCRDTHKALDYIASQASTKDVNGRWLVENYRLIRTAEKESRQLANAFREYRTVVSESAGPLPLPYVVAQGYLGASFDFFTEESLSSYIGGFQEIHELSMAELWALKPALQLVILERIASCSSQPGASVPILLGSLRSVGECYWKEMFESISVVHNILSLGDPAGTYARMDYESRENYRIAIAELARNAKTSEHHVAEAAVELATTASESERQKHVGYWIIDRGLESLRAKIGYRAPVRRRLLDFVLRWPQSFYLIGIEVLTLLIVGFLLEWPEVFIPTLAAVFLLILPATQAAVDFMNNLTSYLATPRALPKLDFSEGIPADCATLVAVPTLLLNERQVRQLAMDLEIRFLANRDPNLFFALITDSPDSDQAHDERDSLAGVCVDLIQDLNRRYGSGDKTPFYLFHRFRTYNASEGRWMGWERKRGKLLDLNQFMRGGFDAFPIKVGNMAALPGIRYVITLDSDTQLPRDAAQKLVGAIAHPLHRAVIDPVTKMVVAGYGILQPRIGISIQSAASSRLASIYSGQTGFDIYTRAISDVYQDLFGEGIFTGKGIYDIDALRAALDRPVPGKRSTQP